MGTSYEFSLGYIQASHPTYAEAWPMLCAIVRDLMTHPARVVAEARRLGAPEQCDHVHENGSHCTLEQIAQGYLLTEHNPIEFYEQSRSITQYSFGDRAFKDHIRRAFCRLVIEDAHRQGIEVNLNVI